MFKRIDNLSLLLKTINTYQYKIYFIMGMKNMGNKYGIYQSTSKSCIFYKQDDDGNQSTFNIFVTSKKDKEEKKELFAFIDNEQIKKENWTDTDIKNVKDVIDAFGGWASDAPIVFELEAKKSMSQCLSSALRDLEEKE